MLAVFCLRLALGMLASLMLLSPHRMHPRFFRTHFLTALGLSVVAAVMGWTTAWDEQGQAETAPWRRAALALAVLAALAGALVWISERPPLGRTLLAAGALALAAALLLFAVQQAAAQRTAATPLHGPAAALFIGDAASAALLGFAVTGMLVGHSYLIQPGLSIRPLMGQLAGLGAALAVRGLVAGAALWCWSGTHDITNLGDETVLFLPVRWGIGFLGPLIFGGMAFQTARIRSTQSATGILYVVVILVFLGELIGLLLTRNTGLPL